MKLAIKALNIWTVSDHAASHLFCSVCWRRGLLEDFTSSSRMPQLMSSAVTALEGADAIPTEAMTDNVTLNQWWDNLSRFFIHPAEQEKNYTSMVNFNVFIWSWASKNPFFLFSCHIIVKILENLVSPHSISQVKSHFAKLTWSMPLSNQSQWLSITVKHSMTKFETILGVWF